jgi:UDP-N-acetylglucosamine:LPS N-acetylglucosamine transferase
MDEYKILILTAPSGHLTQARAVKSYLDDIPNVRIKLLDLEADNVRWVAFRFLYRYFPVLMKIPFEVTKIPLVLRSVKSDNVKRLKRKLPAVLEAEDPDLVITTYHGYIAILDQIKGKSRFHFVNSITDPVGPHPIIFSHAADYNIGFNEACCEIGLRQGVSPEKIVPAGWFTTKSFFEPQPLDRIRRELGLKDRLTLLVCAGSEGNNAILGLLPVLFFNRHSRPFQVIFITGHNHGLANSIHNTYRMAAHLNPGVPPIVVREFTDKMHELMAVSDVVIGKAGPNVIFESVARRKPFIAITHFSGNEDGNLAMIKEYNLGWVTENPFSAAKLIKEIILTPQLLLHKSRDLEIMAARCYESGQFLRHKVLEWKNTE